MAVGKNKRISKGKKGGKKKTVDPFAKKDWYDIKAPSMFTVRDARKTLVSERSWLSCFGGSFLILWMTYYKTPGTKIASEGLTQRVFQVCLVSEDQSYRKMRKNQVKRTTYAQSCQIRKMVEIMVNQASSCDFKKLVAKIIPELFGKEIEKATSGIYPLQNAFIPKAKFLKAPNFGLGKPIYAGSWR
ncbi:hypothetical protein MKX03_005324 [Papaver bracteatum]|nr:hypothetical protein MKX03_005324 [Papaver bracteatum]